MKPILGSLSLLTGFLCAVAPTRAADVIPIVEVGTDYLIGAFTGGKWLVSEEAAKRVKPGTRYRVYSLTGELGAAKGGKPTPGEDVCPEVFTVALAPKNDKGVIAVAAPWNALPRIPRLAATTQPVYLAAAREFLQSHGISEPQVKITRIVRIDLDGDGKLEVVVQAAYYEGSWTTIYRCTPAKVEELLVVACGV